MVNVDFEFMGKYAGLDEESCKRYIAICNDVMNRADYLLDGSDFEVCIIFADNDVIQDINKEYRGMDRPTDVLSFPQFDLCDGEGYIDEELLCPETGKAFLGDIVVSLDKAIEQAKEYGHDEEREVAFLVVHGFLHLLGFDHDTKEREELMLENAYRILNEAGYKR